MSASLLANSYLCLIFGHLGGNFTTNFVNELANFADSVNVNFEIIVLETNFSVSQCCKSERAGEAPPPLKSEKGLGHPSTFNRCSSNTIIGVASIILLNKKPILF